MRFNNRDKYENVARLCHQVNKAYCESIGDYTQVDWDEAPDWQRNSAIEGVVHHIENDDITPEDSHNNWLAEKTRNGWLWGKKKDAELKTHPCIIPYSELPIKQKSKDYIFKAICDFFKGSQPKEVNQWSKEVMCARKKEHRKN